MELQAVGDQGRAHQHQERQRQHLQRRVLGDKAADGVGEHHHEAHRDHHRDHHHFNVVGHAHRGDHRVQREHHVENRDLNQDAHEGAAHLGLGQFVGLAGVLDGVVNLQHRFHQQEQAAQYQHQIAPGNALPQHHEQIGGELGQPGQ